MKYRNKTVDFGYGLGSEDAMGKYQYWIPLLLCVGGAAAGLAVGYWSTVLGTGAQSSESTFAEELLGYDQAFPPSDNWPGNTARVAHDVLFEDASPEWANGPSTSPLNRSESWSSTTIEAELDRKLENDTSGVIENAAVASDAAVEPSDLSEDLIWEESSADLAAEQVTVTDAVSAQGAVVDEAESTGGIGTAEAASVTDFPMDEVPSGGAKVNADAHWQPDASVPNTSVPSSSISGEAGGDREPVF